MSNIRVSPVTQIRNSHLHFSSIIIIIIIIIIITEQWAFRQYFNRWKSIKPCSDVDDKILRRYAAENADPNSVLCI
jgi:hypothetical protein